MLSPPPRIRTNSLYHTQARDKLLLSAELRKYRNVQCVVQPQPAPGISLVISPVFVSSELVVTSIVSPNVCGDSRGRGPSNV